MNDPRMRDCPCCGQPVGWMTDDAWHGWLWKQISRLQLEGKPDLATALAAFTAALELGPDQ